MQWEQGEIKTLTPILEQIRANLAPLAGKRILVLCSAAGEVAFSLSEDIGQGEIIGLELSDELLGWAQDSVKRRGLGKAVIFQKAELSRIPMPDKTFDALVSENRFQCGQELPQ